jgi:hypothetical protein
MLRRCVTRLCCAFVGLCLLGLTVSGTAQEPKWEDGETYEVDGLKLHLSKPRLVHRSKGFLWFPSMYYLGGERLFAVASTYADEARKVTPGVVTFSKDGGLTWSKPIENSYGEMAIARPDGSTLLLCYYLQFQSPDRATGPACRIPKDKEQVEAIKEEVEVSGWPRKIGLLDADLGNPKAEWKLASFVFNGQSVLTKDGKTHLATLYGRFAGTKRYSLVLAESTDGLKWKIRSVIADDGCKLAGQEGPCESALVRLKDGRLLSVFRLDSVVAFGHCFSDDDGKTWSEPKNLTGTHSVQPSLSVSETGMLLLSGGRLGLLLWLNRQGDAVRWDKIDLARHHNQWIKDEPILKAVAAFDSNTSSYTEVRWLDDQRFLVVYDRLANGWHAIPADSTATNSIWVVRGQLREES